MVKQNSVIFKGKNDGILILLDDKISFDELKQVFKEKLQKSSNFFKGANISITFKGRDLSESEEIELLNIISEISGLNISFVHEKSDSPVFVKQQKLSKIDNVDIKAIDEKSKEASKKEDKKNALPKTFLTALENITSFHKGSIRSGQSLKFKGSIVVIGDVNPGGEIIAEGNVIVLGSVKGLIHAGCSGLSDCFVIGLDLRPTQLRIADIVTYFPKKSKNDKAVPECAFAKNGEIYVENLDRKALI